jgi:hypothetical protein
MLQGMQIPPDEFVVYVVKPNGFIDRNSRVVATPFLDVASERLNKIFAGEYIQTGSRFQRYRSP